MVPRFRSFHHIVLSLPAAASYTALGTLDYRRRIIVLGSVTAQDLHWLIFTMSTKQYKQAGEDVWKNRTEKIVSV